MTRTAKPILSSRPDSWESFFELAKGVSRSFLADRKDQPPQKRVKGLKLQDWTRP